MALRSSAHQERGHTMIIASFHEPLQVRLARFMTYFPTLDGGRWRTLAAAGTLIMGVLLAGVGLNVGAVAPAAVPAAITQEAEAHGTHEMDPCVTYASPVRRELNSTLLVVNGGSHACVANDHAKYHNIYTSIRVMIYEFYKKGPRKGQLKRSYWRTLVTHHSARPINRALTVQPRISCVPGMNRYMSVSRHGVNGDLGPRFWTVESYPVRIDC